MLTLTRMGETALAGTMPELSSKFKSTADAVRPRVSREKRETVGAVRVENPRMVCRNVNVSYGDKHAIKNVSIDIGRNEVLEIGRASCRERV